MANDNQDNRQKHVQPIIVQQVPAPRNGKLDALATKELIGGIVGGTLSYLGAGVLLEKILLPYTTEVNELTRNDIIRRGGVGAGLSENGSLGAGLGEHSIRAHHETELLKNPKYKTAKNIRYLGGQEGVQLGVAVVGAAIAAVVTKSLLGNSSSKQNDAQLHANNYAEQIANERSIDPSEDITR